MNKLHDLLAKLQAIEESAKTSDIPAAHRKAKNPDDWKVSMKDLDDESKEGKISHKDTLAKNTGKQVNEWDAEDDTRGDGEEASIHHAMKELGISLNDITPENVWDIGEKISDHIGSGYNNYWQTNSDHRDVSSDVVLDYLSKHIDLSGISEESVEPVSDAAPEQSDVSTVAQAGNAQQGGAGASDESVVEGGWDINDPDAAAKQQALNQRVQDTQGGAGASDESVQECGGDMNNGGNVTMSMHDLLALMNHLQGKGSSHDEPLMGSEERVGEEYENSVQGDAGPEIMPIAAVTGTGNDMFSKGLESPKVNGGGNPMQEALADLYASVKARQLDELSKGTLKSYAKKATSDMSDKSYVAGHAAGKGKDARSVEVDKTAYKRMDGINKAIDKLSLKEANQVARKLRK